MHPFCRKFNITNFEETKEFKIDEDFVKKVKNLFVESAIKKGASFSLECNIGYSETLDEKLKEHNLKIRYPGNICIDLEDKVFWKNGSINIDEKFQYDKSLSFEINLKRIYSYLAICVLKESIKRLFDRLSFELNNKKYENFYSPIYVKNPLLISELNFYLNEFTIQIYKKLGLKTFYLDGFYREYFENDGKLVGEDKELSEELIFILQNTGLEKRFYEMRQIIVEKKQKINETTKNLEPLF